MQAGEKRLEAQARVKLAHMYLVRNEPGNALRETEEAMSIFRKLGDKRGRAKACELVADAHFWLVPAGSGNAPEAIRRAQEAVTIFHGLKDTLRESSVLHTLANAQLLGKKN